MFPSIGPRGVRSSLATTGSAPLLHRAVLLGAVALPIMTGFIAILALATGDRALLAWVVLGLVIGSMLIAETILGRADIELMTVVIAVGGTGGGTGTDGLRTRLSQSRTRAAQPTGSVSSFSVGTISGPSQTRSSASSPQRFTTSAQNSSPRR